MTLSASPRVAGYIGDVVTNINQVLQFADNWSALKEENTAMGWNGSISVEDLDAVFGVGVVTPAQFTAAFNTMQSVADFIHNGTNGPKLYKLKR